MFYSLNFLKNHALNCVSDLAGKFFKESYKNDKFGLILFPAWFVPVIQAATGKNGIDKKFKELFALFKALDKKDQREIIEFLDNLNLEKLCLDDKTKLIQTERWPKFHEQLQKVFKDHLFESTIKKSSNLKGSIKALLIDHYYDFKALNKIKICPFCGLHNYNTVDGEPADSYDHWLSKSNYPLVAIHIENLSPMCTSCNSNGVKGNREILHDCERKNNRVKAYYPFKNHSGIKLKVVKYIHKDSLPSEDKPKYPLGRFCTEFQSLNKNEDVATKNWVRVFNLKERYDSYISDGEIEAEFHSLYQNDNRINDNSKQKELIEEFKNNLPALRFKGGVEGVKAYLDFLLTKGNESYLATFFGQNLRRSKAA